MHKVIFLMGPTAAGKTDIAVQAAMSLPIDLISVDSVLIYKFMDVGTAKPDAETLAKAPHALIDLIEPEQSFSVAEFCQLAIKEIDKSHHAGRTPMLVGGTMMYFNALQYGLSKLPEANIEIRSELELIAQQKGWKFMHQQLSEVDLASAKRIHPNDTQRIQRALEIYQVSGRTMTELLAQQPKHKFPYKTLKLISAWQDREQLRARIAQRFELMLTQNFLKEVELLRARRGLSSDHPSMRSVGYRQMWEHLDGHLDYAEMKERAIIATRQLAKRQYTWLRKMQDAQWFYMEYSDSKSQVLSKITDFIDNAQETSE
ncbi:tRNA dimethylallyltransferase [hydrothermal vent metagenome]|uniref:tRNA dimethylallyltransferase n=1 Tax=hydrothermal vent metagenome TaxID=652676 RepID=A0A3B0YCN9_9ZZZZ